MSPSQPAKKAKKAQKAKRAKAKHGNTTLLARGFHPTTSQNGKNKDKNEEPKVDQHPDIFERRRMEKAARLQAARNPVSNGVNACPYPNAQSSQSAQRRDVPQPSLSATRLDEEDDDKGDIIELSNANAVTFALPNLPKGPVTYVERNGRCPRPIFFRTLRSLTPTPSPSPSPHHQGVRQEDLVHRGPISPLSVTQDIPPIFSRHGVSMKLYLVCDDDEAFGDLMDKLKVCI